jgi:hypothetical protein
MFVYKDGFYSMVFVTQNAQMELLMKMEFADNVVKLNVKNVQLSILTIVKVHVNQVAYLMDIA